MKDRFKYIYIIDLTWKKNNRPWPCSSVDEGIVWYTKVAGSICGRGTFKNQIFVLSLNEGTISIN